MLCGVEEKFQIKQRLNSEAFAHLCYMLAFSVLSMFTVRDKICVLNLINSHP